MTESRRDLLVKTAVDLFYRNGYHATGIDKILTAAGVSKPTLYRHFNSKDDLIIAALESWDTQCRGWMKDEMQRRGDTPRAQLLALFDTLGDWFEEAGFQGCMFINATVEFAGQDNPIHAAARRHKDLFADYIRGIAAAAGARDPAAVTEHLMILMEGAIVTAHTAGKSAAAQRAKTMAEAILAQAID